MKKLNKCAILTIGDELLIGQTIDTNSAWIAQQLNPLGLEMIQRIAVGDSKSAIREGLNYIRQIADLIFITGGLGPTSDDITKPFLCEYFGGKLVCNEAVLEHVRHYFESRKRVILDSNLRQAWVPDCCEVLFNQVGTAPGMWFENNGQIFISLPGVPFEMQHIVGEIVLPKLKPLCGLQNIQHRTLITCGEGESFIAERLKTFEQELPNHIKIAYLPQLNLVKLRLSSSNDHEEIDSYFQKLQQILAHILVATEDIELERLLARILTERNETLSIAESCTGGHLAAKLTALKGASSIFKGGMVPYSIESKINVLGVPEELIEQHSAVSQEVVESMAFKCRSLYKTDYAIAISGYLEKGDHDNEVWIGLSSSTMLESFKIHVRFDRLRNTIVTLTVAMDALRKFIIKH
jgi:nicotinamide-nucleotide amidase